MYSHLLVPLDGSDLAEKALPQAEVLAKSFSAALHLVQVFSVPRELVNVLEVGVGIPPSVDSNLNLAHLIAEAGRSKIEAYLEDLAAQVRDNGIEVETAVLEGIADEKILAYAKEHDVDCIVLTTQGLGCTGSCWAASPTD
jgi:nucleotide-binding universal stress UspA family protein